MSTYDIAQLTPLIETVFTDEDVAFIANRFTLPELRNALRKVETEIAVARNFGDSEVEVFYEDYLEVIEVAIKQLKATQPKITRVPSYMDTETIKANSDIVAVIENYTKLRKSGKRFSGKCPLHNGKTLSSLSVYPDTQSWHCFGCQRGGDVFDFITATEKTDFRGAAAILGGR